MDARWGRLAAGCLVMAMIGFIYGWSVFSAPLVEEFGWAPSALSLTFTLLMWAFCAGGIIGGRLVRRIPARAAVWLAAALSFAAFATTALLARAEAPWLLYLTYGVLGGCGVGIAYTAAMGATMAWFPDRTGLASGLMLLCYCLSTMALSSVAAWLFDAIGWRAAFGVLGAATAAVTAAAALFLRPPRPGELAAAGARRGGRGGRRKRAGGLGEGGEVGGVSTDRAARAGGGAVVAEAGPAATTVARVTGAGASASTAATASGGKATRMAGAGGAAGAEATGAVGGTAAASPADATTAAMLRAPAFWAYATWMLAVSCIGLAVIGSANQLALGAGAAPAVAVAAVGMLALCNGLGRLLMGVAFDALGTAACTVVDALMLGTAVLLLAGAQGSGEAALALAGLALAGLGAGGTSVIGSGFMATVFGETHYAENLAILNLTLIPAALVGPLVLNGPLAATGSYGPGLGALVAAAALAAALGLALRRLLRA